MRVETFLQARQIFLFRPIIIFLVIFCPVTTFVIFSWVNVKDFHSAAIFMSVMPLFWDFFQ